MAPDLFMLTLCRGAGLMLAERRASMAVDMNVLENALSLHAMKV